ncbi:MAG: hypothetical protein ACRDJE_14265 [Dehalococcoidia bacterium]
MRIIAAFFAALFLVASAIAVTATVPTGAFASCDSSSTESGAVIVTCTDPADPAYPPQGTLIPESCTYWGGENGLIARCTPARVVPPGATVCVLVGTENGPDTICYP